MRSFEHAFSNVACIKRGRYEFAKLQQDEMARLCRYTMHIDEVDNIEHLRSFYGSSAPLFIVADSWRAQESLPARKPCTPEEEQTGYRWYLRWQKIQFLLMAAALAGSELATIVEDLGGDPTLEHIQRQQEYVLLYPGHPREYTDAAPVVAMIIACGRKTMTRIA
jgi:hypothetical protein